MKDVFLFLFIIIVILLIWFVSGGNMKDKATPSDDIINSNASISSGDTSTSGNAKTTKGSVFIVNTDGARKQDPSTEYITIQANKDNKKNVDISGWILKNSSGEAVVIKKAARLPLVGVVNTESQISLKPGDTVTITTGQSPIGSSFQENMCSGYLGQYQDFTPAIEKSCPSLEKDIENSGLDQLCKSYINSIPDCEASPEIIPSNLSSTCVSYVQNQLNYNSCVSANSASPNFYKSKWRIFLGMENEFWNNANDLVRLYNQSSKLIDSKSY